MIKHDTLLLCSPSREHRQELRPVFADAYNLLESGDPRQLMQLLKQNLSCTAAVLVDISTMPQEDMDWLHREENHVPLGSVPVIILVSGDMPEILPQAITRGAADVIPVNYDPTAMLHRVDNIVALSLHKQHLEALVAEHKQQLRQTSDTLVDALSSIIEYRSVETGQHILRIRHFTRILLEEVKKCCPEYQLSDHIIDIICSASALHDIGKIAIPDGILTKPGPLTEEERQIMKTHAETGCRILETLENMADAEYLSYAHNICHYHHERWDGGGYPEGLQGDAIPICAQVVGLADVYDALTTNRVYKDAYSFSKAVNMIFRGECGVFSPKLLDCFKHVAHKFEHLAAEYADGKIPDTGLPQPIQALPEVWDVEDGIERLRGKYFALLHYINGLLIELDMDRQIFHLVYNPYPELASLQEMDTLSEIANLLCSQFVHPQDLEKMRHFLSRDIYQFLDDGLRRAGYRFRFNSRTGDNIIFELTLLRINPLNTKHRTLAVLAKKIQPEQILPAEPYEMSVPLEGTFSCKNDQHFTLVNLGRFTSLLAGYTADEIRTGFGSRLLELVYPEDREMVRRQFTEFLKLGSDVRLEHRIVHKNGSVRWVYNNSRLVTDGAGQEIIHSYLVDSQDLHRDDTALQEKLQRYEMILAQTENVLFDWDMIHDTITFSDTWEKIFGRQSVSMDQQWSQYWMSCLHPDDIPLLADCISRLQNGSSYEMVEVRIAAANGRYHWCRFRATAIRDPRGQLQRIFGIIINIDTEKQAEQALQNRAEQDSLTKLLNKDAARKQAEEYFSRYAAATGGALLIIDLDDFKQINDRKGHLFGDTVLVKVAQEIRKLFRSQDIVARIGGDEFMVVMRGITDQNLLEQRCNQLVQIFTTTFRGYNLTLTCSVGIALAPKHGLSYFELFHHADQALYQAKAKGKNCYAIYHPEDSGYWNRGRTATVRNPIDSDTQPGMANDNVVRYAFQKLYSSQDIHKSINELLGFIGEKTNVSRVYVFENSDDNRFCHNTYEWCNAGIPSEIQNLQNISYETDIPGYADNFDEQGIFYCPDVALLPKNVYDIVAPQGIRAMLHCAIRENGVFRGYIGFDDCIEPRMWTKEQIELLLFFSESLSLFLLRQRRQEKLERQAQELRSVLDNSAAWSYVVDPETHELFYTNTRLQNQSPHSLPGSICYRVLENRESPCLNCPMVMLNGRANYSCLHHRGDGETILLEAVKLHWNGEPKVLISGRQIPDVACCNKK